MRSFLPGGRFMRAYYFFMKFWRSFLIGFGCGLIALAVIAAVGFAVYCLYFS